MQYKLNKSNLKELLNIEHYDDNQLEEYIRNNYEGIDKLSITEEEIIIEVSDKPTPNNQFRRLVHFSEKGKYQEAIQLAEELLKDTPSHSEVNRILGQIYFVQDKMELAEEYVLNALRWNPENQHALTLMGNIQYKPKDQIKSIAFEFAKLGMAGIDPKKDNYSVPSIDKKMTGYQALAYYYVSWALAIPEHVAELQLPFEREYEVAQKMN